MVDSIDVKIDMLDRQIDVLKAERRRAVVRIQKAKQNSCDHSKHTGRTEEWADHHKGEVRYDYYCGNCNKLVNQF